MNTTCGGISRVHQFPVLFIQAPSAVTHSAGRETSAYSAGSTQKMQSLKEPTKKLEQICYSLVASEQKDQNKDLYRSLIYAKYSG